MELGKARMWDPQLDRGDRGLDRVHVLPVDVALGHRQAQVPSEGPVAAFDAQAPEEARGADIHRDQVQDALDLVESQVVDAHDLPAINVDDLLVHEIRVQQDLVRALAEATHVDRRGPEARAAGIDPIDRRPGQEDPAAVRRDHQASHGRVAIADGHDQIRDLPDRVLAAVKHGQADRLAQVEHGHLEGGPVAAGWHGWTIGVRRRGPRRV